MKIAIVSDIHMQGGALDQTRSFATVGQPPDKRANPFDGLMHLIRGHKIKADVLVCCGDLADRASPAGTREAWKSVDGLAAQLGGARLFATCGNHDVDSRYAAGGYDPIAELRRLSPTFPIANASENRRFWADHFAVDQVNGTRFVLLNTSAYHMNPAEMAHGRVSQRTADALDAELTARGPVPINVLVCHHHPYKYGKSDALDQSDVQGFGYLSSLLGSGRHGKWLLIHGHRHWPWLSYGHGGSSTPTVFSAGSLAATVWEPMRPGVTNQFYMATIDPVVSASHEMSASGTFVAWDWNVSDGWKRADQDSDLPGQGGFGFRLHLSYALEQLITAVAESPDPYVQWRDVTAMRPRLRYLTPEDRRSLRRLFEDAGGAWDYNGLPDADELRI